MGDSFIYMCSWISRTPDFKLFFFGKECTGICAGIYGKCSTLSTRQPKIFLCCLYCPLRIIICISKNFFSFSFLSLRLE